MRQGLADLTPLPDKRGKQGEAQCLEDYIGRERPEDDKKYYIFVRHLHLSSLLRETCANLT
jgi:hypothetical protein